MPEESVALATLTGASTGMTALELMIAAEVEEDADAYKPMPTRLKIAPGGIGVFATEDGDTMQFFDAIVAVSQMARAYWPERSTGKRPLCSSPDGGRGVFNVDHDEDQFSAALNVIAPHHGIRLMTQQQTLPEKFDCDACPLNAWGSQHQGDTTGRGKACKELRRLLLIVKGWTAPALLSLPPTSLKSWDLYCTAAARNKSAYFAAWTDFRLEGSSSDNGEPFSVVTVSRGSPLVEEELRTVLGFRADYAELVKAMEIDGEEYQTVDGVASAVDDDDEDVPF